MTQKDLQLFIGYFICGSIATAVDLTALYSLTEFLHIWYFYSAIISYSFGVIINFSLNKYFNFKNKDIRVWRQFGIFVFVSIIGLGLNQAILYFSVELIHLWYMLAKIIAIAIVFIWSFFAHKTITFRQSHLHN